MYLQDIYDDCLVLICKYLSISTLAALRLTATRFRNITSKCIQKEYRDIWQTIPIKTLIDYNWVVNDIDYCRYRFSTSYTCDTNINITSLIDERDNREISKFQYTSISSIKLEQVKDIFIEIFQPRYYLYKETVDQPLKVYRIPLNIELLSLLPNICNLAHPNCLRSTVPTNLAAIFNAIMGNEWSIGETNYCHMDQYNLLIKPYRLMFYGYGFFPLPFLKFKDDSVHKNKSKVDVEESYLRLDIDDETWPLEIITLPHEEGDLQYMDETIDHTNIREQLSNIFIHTATINNTS